MPFKRLGLPNSFSATGSLASTDHTPSRENSTFILFVIVLDLLVMEGGIRVPAPLTLVRVYAKLYPELGIHIAPKVSYLASYKGALSVASFSR